MDGAARARCRRRRAGAARATNRNDELPVARPRGRMQLRLLLVAVAVGLPATCTSSVAASSAPPSVWSGVRLPLELDGQLEVKRRAAEPPFKVGEAYSCVFGRAGQFSLHMPPQDYHDLGVHTKGHGIAQDADTLICTVPRVVTAGNTTVCAMPPNATDTHFPAFRPMGDVDQAAERRRLIDSAEGKHATCETTPCKT